ncbi:uncharacterized protein LOC136071215 [Quercus suber]|uniref:uncharacterized protein LOC136071215 n=1 Tax=Quercus suber TaxID=58331 RepID=UPI0032DF6D29
MDRSQSLNVSPFFDSNNYAFWKIHMRAFLCSIDDVVWDAVEVGWTRPEATKSTWDKAALAAANANSKALNAILCGANANSKVLNAIFCGVSPEKFHRISHITVAKEAWEILETTYEGTKKVKDAKLQMLTTLFEELKMSEDESFDSFYSKLNEVVIRKFNLGEKMEDSIVVRKILWSLPESFRAKVTAIEESKDLDDIKIQELVGSLQTYELSLPTQKKSKSFALKTIDERVVSHDSPEENAIDKDVAYLVKNFRKFLKLKNGGKFGDKGKFQSFGREKKEFRRKDDRDSQSSQGITCFKCNGHGHFKKECPNYLKSKGKVYATTLSDTDSSNPDSEDSCDGEGNYSAFMTIGHVESSDDLGSLVKELGEHSDLESIGIKHASDKSRLGYTGGSSSSANVTKEVKFVKAKETVVDKPIPEKFKTERKKNVNDQWVVNKSRNQSEARFGARGRSLPRS